MPKLPAATRSSPPHRRRRSRWWRLRGEALFGLQRFGEALHAFDRTAAIGGPPASGSLGWRVACLVQLRDGARLDALLRDFVAQPPPWAGPEEVAQAEGFLDRFSVR